MRKLMITPPLLVGLLVILLVGFDIFPYAAISTEIAIDGSVKKHLEISKKNISADVDQFVTCQKLARKTQPVDYYHPAVRECLLSALPTVKTWIGVVTLSKMSAMWLDLYPNDDAIRAATLGAIKQGKSSLAADQAVQTMFYDQLKQLIRARDRSLIVSLFSGYKTGPGALTLPANAVAKKDAEFQDWMAELEQLEKNLQPH